MNVRSIISLLCALLILTATPAYAVEPDTDQNPRSRIAAYALQIHDYTWTLPEEEGVILLYNRNYFARTNGNRLIFDITPPYVAYGTVRGIPCAYFPEPGNHFQDPEGRLARGIAWCLRGE